MATTEQNALIRAKDVEGNSSIIYPITKAENVDGLEESLAGKSDTSHNHDDRYYTETEIDSKLNGKSDTSHTHDDRYYTETEIDSKLSGKSDISHTHSQYVNQNAFSKVAVGSTTIEADSATDTLTLAAGSNITLTPDASGDKVTIAAKDTVYTHPSSGVTAGTYKSVTVNAQGHVTGGTNPTTLAGYGITDAESKGAAATALSEAKTYADSAATTAANNVKNDLLNGAGAAYDTLKELGDLIDTNTDAIDALETVAAGKADATALNTHTSNTTSHITSTERTNWNAAKTHADSAHAPSNAEKNQNAFSNIVVGSTTVAADTATDTLTLAGSNVTLTPDVTNDKVTIGITKANVTSALGYTPPTTNTTYSAATTSAAGLMSASDKSKLDGIASGANAYSLPTATSSTLGGVKTGSNITNSSGTISLTKANVTSALGYTPPTTNTTYSAATTSAAGLMSASDKSKLDGIASGATKITVDSALSSSSTNPVQNKVINTALAGKAASSHTHNYAGSSSSGGAATSANKLNTNAGDSNTPVYFSNGVPVACTSLDLNTTGSSASCTGNAATATKATQDASGNTITSTYMTKDDPTGSGSVSIGRMSNTTIGSNSVAMGYDTTASGNYSIAMGYDTTASGKYSIAMGVNLIASGYASFAAGYETTASMDGSFAAGRETEASGYHSTAMGYATKATGDQSVAIGYESTALDYQLAMGWCNNTTNAVANQTVYGAGSGTAFVIGNGTTSTPSNAFRVDYKGKTYGKSAYTSNGCDYAEYFEWMDSNPNNEDRRGYFVTLDGDKIKIAKSGDYILGIISGHPAVIGNGDEDWMGRYILDDFGEFIYEDYEYETEEPEEVIDEETGAVTIQMKTVKRTCKKYKENPDYDPSIAYVQREDRPEWDAVGMVGVLSVRDDGTCQVNGYCKVAEGGTGTASDEGYRVIKRVNDNIVKVIFR